ncbi:phosphotransferase [Aestuariirhabdus litorea]|uniref:Phosphotransferase family protein n=1 Tax=Aestuariirhabdus litorea TaxID=2528527 RepID=A0A3P3VPE2_9GAMM|nr:phosphotransferase [Aestuariirhabdus litorea]RRJ83788.1 phosphotransferase family protein [Aestuariirhabdus litorea]RWW97011.1 phosphotransferase family protein [Endozoicomonadaceae bacterium GTF-13]
MSEQIETLNETLLADYLEQQVPGFKGPLTATKFSGGQSNPTFKIEAASGTYVLRRQPPGKLLKSAHAVDREYRVIKALADSEVPVAQVYHLCEDPSVIGSMFYLMEFCDGRIFWDAALPEVDTATRSAMYDEMNRVLAALHSVDIDAVGLSDYGKPGNYFERQLGRWSAQYRASELERIEAMEQLMGWLEQNMPADDGRVALSHGDFRLDNLMFHPTEPRVIAVLDWELSTLGHPFADLAYQCMQLRMPGKIGNMSGLMGVDLKALGIPSEQEYIARYCQRMGIEKIDNWAFYLAFSFFRLAAIVQGVAKRAADGNASNREAAKVGAFVGPLAELALGVIQQEGGR